MKSNPEFDNFTAFMDKLAKVPHSELKEKLEEEKRNREEMTADNQDRRAGESIH